MVNGDICALIDLQRPEDVVRARQEGRTAARAFGFGMADQTRLATAISEITRNALHYGGGGQCEIVGKNFDHRREIVVTVTDKGPGIPDIEKAMMPGFSTGASLGMGLPGAKKLVDTLEVETRPGMTCVEMIMSRRIRR